MHPFVWEGVWNLRWYKLIGMIGVYFIMIYNDRRVFQSDRPVGYKTEVVLAKLRGVTKSEKLINMYIFGEAESITGFYTSNIIFNRFFADLFDTNANYFGTLVVVPFLWVLISAFYGHNPLKKLDFMTLCLPLYLVFAKVGCFMAGCCRGIPWEYGPYNEVYGQERQVPVQLIEAALALIIFFILKEYKKKAKDGTVFPVYMILYCSTRFFSEFLRASRNVLGPLKMYQILCIAGLIYGIILLPIVALIRNKVAIYYDKKYEESAVIVEELLKENEGIHVRREKKALQKQREKTRKKLYRNSRKL